MVKRGEKSNESCVTIINRILNSDETFDNHLTDHISKLCLKAKNFSYIVPNDDLSTFLTSLEVILSFLNKTILDNKILKESLSDRQETIKMLEKHVNKQRKILNESIDAQNSLDTQMREEIIGLQHENNRLRLKIESLNSEIDRSKEMIQVLQFEIDLFSNKTKNSVAMQTNSFKEYINGINKTVNCANAQTQTLYNNHKQETSLTNPFGNKDTHLHKDLKTVKTLSQRNYSCFLSIHSDSHGRDLSNILRRNMRNVTSFVKPGAKTETIVGPLLPRLKQAHPEDLIVILAGSNDMYRQKDLRNAKHYFNKLLEELPASVNLVICTVPVNYSSNLDSLVNRNIVNFNSYLKDISWEKKNVFILETTSKRRHFTSHGLHLNIRGKMSLCNSIYRTTQLVMTNLEDASQTTREARKSHSEDRTTTKQLPVGSSLSAIVRAGDSDSESDSEGL